MDLTRADCLTEACRALHDAGLDIEHAHDVLTELDVDPDRVAAALNEKHYNAATGRPEALWTAPDQRRHSRRARELRSDDAAPPQVPPHHVVQRVAASGEPLRLAQLSDDFGLDPGQSIELWASAGLPTDLIAKATVATHHGDIPAAVADLDARWPAEPVDWQALTATPTRPRTCTDGHLSCDREAVDPDGPADAAQDPRTGDGVTTDDDLLCALDQLTNTVYWCRQRGMPITAGSAILEAVGDWLDSQDPTRDDACRQ